MTLEEDDPRKLQKLTDQITRILNAEQKRLKTLETRDRVSGPAGARTNDLETQGWDSRYASAQPGRLSAVEAIKGPIRHTGIALSTV